MASARDYFDYLTDQVGISPANSQEELNAAQTIAELMREHGLDTSIEEFDTASLARLPHAFLLVIMFIGVVIAGMGRTMFAAIGLLITLACVALLVLDYVGNNVFEHFGPSARSQNVVAMHEASGPLVTKGNRPIVVMAHYDAPRESFLYSSGIAKYLPILRRCTRWCVLAATVCALIQILRFLPEPARRVFWVIGILAAIPPLVSGIGSIAERFSSCSLGANDNTSSVAALFGVLEAVFSNGTSEILTTRLSQRRNGDERGEASVRRGEETLRSLGILPESCAIEYVEEPEGQPAVALGDEDAADATSNLDAASEPEPDVDATVVSMPTLALADGDAGDPDETQYYQPPVADAGRRSALFDLPDPGEDSKDPLASPATAAPRSVRSALADRLSFADEQNARRIQESLGTFDEPDDTFDGLDAPVLSYDVDLDDAEVAPVHDEPKPKRKSFSLFGRKRLEEESLSDLLGIEDDYDAKSAGREIGSWEELEEQDEEFSRRRKSDPRWKGGAAAADELRDGDEEPTDGEKLEASASLGIDELLCHDIWFVALGANGLDHAGMKAFIAKHRPRLRGAFVINLDSIGAGNLSVLTSEGVGNTRRVDRRISRLLKGVAKDLDIDLLEVPFDWGSTDATPAMRSSMRAATIMGVNEMGLPALSRTPEDVPENVDPEQIARVSTMVTEFIRRS